MKASANRFVVPALLFAATVIVAFNAWFAFRAVDSLLLSQHWVEHTWQVINQVESIMGSAKDAETGSRGFLITGDDLYLQPYKDAQRELPQELDHFQWLTSDNPAQLPRITEMRAVLEQRMALLQEGIDLRRSGNNDAIRALVLSGTGKAQMDHLRRIADEIEADERRLLATRTAQAKADSRRTRYTI